MHVVRSARCFAFANAGSNMAARMAMIAMTTSNSINVNARASAWVDFIERPFPSVVWFRLFRLFFLCLILFVSVHWLPGGRSPRAPRSFSHSTLCRHSLLLKAEECVATGHRNGDLIILSHHSWCAGRVPNRPGPQRGRTLERVSAAG